MDKSQLLAAIKSRTGRTGLLTADRYVRSLLDCAGGACPTIGGDSEQWQKAVKEAEGKLVWTPENCEIKGVTDLDMSKAVFTFDCVVTTTRRDRDFDILETKGAELDPKAPLLFNHMTFNPIGAVVGTLKHAEDSLSVRCAIADTLLGRDMAVLAEFGALRISHGFEPKEFTPLKDQGWHIKQFEIWEVSLVAVPSNTDGIITAFSRGKLHEPLVKAWAEKKLRRRTKVHPVGVSFKMKINGASQEFTAPDHEELKRVIAATKAPEKPCECHKELLTLDQMERIGKAAKARLQSVNLYTLPGSWEHTENCLRETLRSYLSEAGAMKSCDCCGGCGCYDCGYSWVLGTFDGYAIVCFDGPAGITLHKLAWAMAGDMPQWSGEPQEVEIEVSAEIIEKSRASHVLRLKGPEPESFDLLEARYFTELSRQDASRACQARNQSNDLIAHHAKQARLATYRKLTALVTSARE